MKTFKQFMSENPLIDQGTKDLKAVTDLVNKYKPIVDQKKKQYKTLIKQQGEVFKNEAEKNLVPAMKDFANSFKDAFSGKGVNSNSFNKK
tara:strand:- start:91 stop:360 length:270 start_codon:yes stop_codon:yes gene_type:complete